MLFRCIYTIKLSLSKLDHSAELSSLARGRGGGEEAVSELRASLFFCGLLSLRRLSPIPSLHPVLEIKLRTICILDKHASMELPSVPQ